MGMDVYGKNATSENGKYFRANIWGWRPLWKYCQKVSRITDEIKYGDSNDGDGLDSVDSLILHNDIENSIKSGFCEKYVNEYEKQRKQIPKEVCWICEGTGKRREPPNIGKGSMNCNGCNTTGMKESYDSFYLISVEIIQKFSNFLKDCGGFEIS